MMGAITATVTLVCPTLFSKNPINNTLGKDAIKNIKIHSSVFSTLGLLSLLSLGVDIFILKNVFIYLFLHLHRDLHSPTHKFCVLKVLKFLQKFILKII